MIKHALTVALLGIAMGCTDPAPVHAAPLPSGVAAPFRIADAAVVKVGGVCLNEIPIVQIFVVFYELTRNREIDCYPRDNRDHNDWRAYEEPQYLNYKDGPYTPPRHPKDAR